MRRLTRPSLALWRHRVHHSPLTLALSSTLPPVSRACFTRPASPKFSLAFAFTFTTVHIHGERSNRGKLLFSSFFPLTDGLIVGRSLSSPCSFPGLLSHPIGAGFSNVSCRRLYSDRSKPRDKKAKRPIHFYQRRETVCDTIRYDTIPNVFLSFHRQRPLQRLLYIVPRIQAVRRSHTTLRPRYTNPSRLHLRRE